MRKTAWLWTIVVLIAVGFFMLPRLVERKEAKLPPAPVASQEVKTAVALPRVITLYQKGDGESDLAAFVSRELSGAKNALASFRTINILDEPQMADFYGVNNMPVVIFVRPNGKLYKKFDGYMEKKKILAVIAQLEKD